MSGMQSVGVTANVRTAGAIGCFERRSFDLMLDQRLPEAQQLTQAIAILRQLGYETRGVHFEINPGN